MDNDCDGEIDESADIPGTGVSCGVDIGQCEAGFTACMLVGEPGEEVYDIGCAGGTFGSDEICNCLDDDCDGLTDEFDDLGFGPDCFTRVFNM